MAELLQTLMQVGAGEGVGQALLHHRLVAERRQAFDEASARALRVEQATGDAQVAHVQHRGTEVACGIEQGGDLADRGFHVRQLQGTAAVLFLGVDDQQGGLAEGGRCITASEQLEQGFRFGHGWAPVAAMCLFCASRRDL